MHQSALMLVNLRRRSIGPRFGRTALTGIVVVALSASVVGCAAGSTPAVGVTTGPTPSVVASAPVEAPSGGSVAAGGAEVGEQAQMLADVYSMLNVATESERVTFLSTNVAEHDVAVCMGDAGFEYVEGPSPAEAVRQDPKVELAPSEYAAKYGLGVTAYELGLVPSPEPDPNEALVNVLSSSERDAYNSAYHQCVVGEHADQRAAEAAAFNAALEKFQDELVTDDSVREAQVSWKSCISAAGFTYDSPDAMRGSFYDRVQSVGNDQAELQQVFADEVAVAKANVPCESEYTHGVRAAVAARMGEFQVLYDANLANPDLTTPGG